MEKRFIAGVFVLLLLVSFVSFNLVHAQEPGVGEEFGEGLGEIPQEVEKTSEKVSSELDSKTQEFLQQNIEIPPALKNFVVGFFKPDKEINFSEMIIMFALFIFIFILFTSLFEFMPFMNQGFQKWVGAFIVTCLAAVSGGIYFGAQFLFSLGNIFDVLNRWGPAKVIFILVILGFIFFALKYLLRILKESSSIANAQSEGIKAAAGKEMLKASYETKFD